MRGLYKNTFPSQESQSFEQYDLKITTYDMTIILIVCFDLGAIQIDAS